MSNGANYRGFSIQQTPFGNFFVCSKIGNTKIYFQSFMAAKHAIGRSITSQYHVLNY